MHVYIVRQQKFVTCDRQKHHYLRLFNVVFIARLFIARVSVLTRDIDIAVMSVCLSIRPSVRHVRVLH